MHYNHPTIIRKVSVSWNPSTKRWRVRDGSNDKLLYEMRRVWLNEVRFWGVAGVLEGRLVSMVVPKEIPFRHRMVLKHTRYPYFAFMDTKEPIVAATQALCGPANVIHVPAR